MLAIGPLVSERLDLEPLRIDHAAEAATAFGDQRLHRYTGGSPATEQQLRARYARQVAGAPPDGSQVWLNWMLRLRGTGQLVGTVQATVTGDAAVVAWVVAADQQGKGFASEAAAAMTAWLRQHGVRRVVAHIHPDHEASVRVARALGLSPTDVRIDGEIRWTDD